MKIRYGVCFGMLVMGMTVVGTPEGRAQSRLAANGESGASVASAGSTGGASTTASASSPAELDRRIEALEMELAELRTELTARKEAQTAAASAAASAPEPTPGVAVAPQDAAKPPEKLSIASLLGPTSVSGFVDAYYQYNANHPVGQGAGLRAFDFRSKQISLNMVELILDKAPDASGPAGRTGYHVSLGFGDAMNTVNATDPGKLGFAQYLKEAYFSYLAPVGKGLQIDVGKFVTPMGAEVIESKDNWNYSRSLLFTFGIPFYHFGARAKYNFNDKFNLTGYLLNGWNNIVDNNSGKTYGMSAGWNPDKKNAITLNYLAGPEQPTGIYGFANAAGTSLVNVNNIWRQTWDLVYMYTPNTKFSFMMNYDYGHGDRFVVNNTTTPFLLSSPVYWTGGAGYLKYSPDDKNYFAARYEYYYDRNGFTFCGGSPVCNASVLPQAVPVPHLHVQEFTATYQRTVSTHVLTRLEYRRDMAGQPIFPLSNFAIPIKHQDTATLGLIFLFDSREAK
jgi:uncharacterized small protein (DUF1192 family)